MNEQPMQMPLTILVAGNADIQALSPELIKAFEATLIDVAGLIIDTPVRILTGMATTIEQAAINIAGVQHWPLHILIPSLLEKDDPIEQKAERVVALGISGDKAQPEEANKLRDELALAFTDLLVVVGDEAQFKDDKRLSQLLITAAIARKPLLWLNLQGLVSVLDIEHLEEGLLHLLKGHQPGLDLLLKGFVRTVGTVPASNQLLKEQLLYPTEIHLDKNSREEIRKIKKIHEYSSSAKAEVLENKSIIGRLFFAGKIDGLFSALIRFDGKDILKNIKSIWNGNSCYWGEVNPEFCSPDQGVNSVNQFERFDVSANSNAGKHRDGIWILYFLSTCAILSAVAGVNGYFEDEYSGIWAKVEFVLLVSIVIGLLSQKKQDWHGRWLAERYMAEQFRYLRMGLPLFAIPKIFTEPVWHVVNNKEGTKKVELRSAELRFLQKVLRAEGLPQMENKKPYLVTDIDLTNFTNNVKKEVEGQIEYHKNKSDKTRKLYKRLHILSLVFFVVTMLAVVVHWQFHYEWLLFATIGLPAVAASLYGIGTKLELTRIANQSRLTVRNLEHIKNSFSTLKQWKIDKPDMCQWEHWLHVRNLTLAASHIMSEENVQWQALIDGQEPELPG